MTTNDLYNFDDNVFSIRGHKAAFLDVYVAKVFNVCHDELIQLVKFVHFKRFKEDMAICLTEDELYSIPTKIKERYEIDGIVYERYAFTIPGLMMLAFLIEDNNLAYDLSNLIINDYIKLFRDHYGDTNWLDGIDWTSLI